MGNITAPTTEDAKRWEGFGSGIKPAFEPIGFYTKPLTLINIFSIICLEITNILEYKLCQKSNVNVKDVKKNLKFIHQQLYTLPQPL